MTGDLIRIDLFGLQGRIAQNEAMSARLMDLRPVYEVAHAAWMMEAEEQFRTEGAYFFGHRWAPLSERYAQWKRRHYGDKPILQRTGRLMKSLTDDTHPDHIAVITAERAAFGTQVPYGKYHQKGGRHLPQRAIVKIRDAFRAFLFRATLRYVLTGEASKFDDAKVD